MANQTQQAESARPSRRAPTVTSPTRRQLLGWTAGGGATLVGALVAKSAVTEAVQAQATAS